MSSDLPPIKPFDRMSGTDQEFAALTELRNRIRKESMPDDPPVPVEQNKAELQNVPPVFDLKVWVSWDEAGRAVASGDVGIPHMETNNHLVQFDIRVLPEYRTKGLGSRLLAEAVSVAILENRRMMIAMTRSTIPAGECFMRELGAEVGLATHVNQLQISDVDRNLLRAWQEKARERAEGFELGLWVGRFPEHELEAIAAMREHINSMPTDDLDIEDFKWTPEQLRQIDDSLEARGIKRWMMYVREKGTGNLAGYTEMHWNPLEPELADQGDTAVSTEYQNRGLGRWLKAAMLEKLLNERPEVTRVRTGNAQSNAPMLKINEELGFRPLMTQNIWQIETQQVVDWLSEHGYAVPVEKEMETVG